MLVTLRGFFSEWLACLVKKTETVSDQLCTPAIFPLLPSELLLATSLVTEGPDDGLEAR